jgi:RimJ/RimL family protein N-acetyltransferase
VLTPIRMVPELSLRHVVADDIGVFFEHQLDPVAIRMVAFTSKDPTDRHAFFAKWDRITGDSASGVRTVVFAGHVAGYVTSFERLGKREVAYWIGREFWGRGVATGALRKLVDEVTTRPLHARAAKDHVASLRVLAKCGFVIAGEERSPNGRGEEVEEYLLELR